MTGMRARKRWKRTKMKTNRKSVHGSGSAKIYVTRLITVTSNYESNIIEALNVLF